MLNIGSSVGISFVTTFVARRSQFHQSILVAQVTPYNQQFRTLLGQAGDWMAQAGSDPFTANRQGMAAIYGILQQQASLLSFVEAFHIMAILYLLCTLLILIMKKPKHARATDAVLH
jgi:DHA2 family multidrug resistance protein